MTRAWEEAARVGAAETLRRLAEEGADLDARDPHGQTALMLAAVRGHLAAARWLVSSGAALDVTAKYGLSAVMLATLSGHAEIVRVLVAAGADLSLRGSGAPGFAGKRALELAADRGDGAIVELLASAARRPDRIEDQRGLAPPSAADDHHG
jgi:ankyrin repeat protein